MDNTTYYQRNREIMLNRANDYYKSNQKRERAKNKYRNLSEEDKEKNRIWKK